MTGGSCREWDLDRALHGTARNDGARIRLPFCGVPPEFLTLVHDGVSLGPRDFLRGCHEQSRTVSSPSMQYPLSLDKGLAWIEAIP